MNDAKLLEINGADYTLYLVFLRQTAKFFLVITIFNAIFMIPLYVTGTPAQNSPALNTIMNDITVLNINENPGRMMFCYFSSIMIVSGLTFALIV